MSGLGKKRSKLGKYLDNRGIKQNWLVEAAELDKNTVSQLAKDDDWLPTSRTMKRVLEALRRAGHNVRQDDFWSM
ncbi:transcriptional regulator [Paenibacillus chitinolyticus]